MRGGDGITKVFLHKGNEDFIVVIESAEILNKWKKDSSIPLTDVVNGFKIFTTHKQGAQGVLDNAPKRLLEDVFGTSNEDDVIKAILSEGQLQHSSTQARESSTNDTMGSMVSHR
jgi:ribosome maturation protein Sdo1